MKFTRTIHTLVFLAETSPGSVEKRAIAEFTDLAVSYCSNTDLEQDEVLMSCRCPITPSWYIFQLLKPILCPQHDQTPISTRLARTHNAIGGSQVKNIKAILGPETVSNLHGVCNKVVGNRTLLHMVAGQLAALAPNGQPARSLHEPSLHGDWIHFAEDIVRNTAVVNLHFIARNGSFATIHGDYFLKTVRPGSGYTPLIHILLRSHNFHDRLTRSQRDFQITANFQRWLHILENCNIDLCEYGKMEESILRQDGLRMARSIYYHHAPFRGRHPEELDHKHLWYILGFKFGPNVCDWVVWWNEPTDKFAGDFWKLIDDPPLHIPGAWYEDEDSDEEMY